MKLFGHFLLLALRSLRSSPVFTVLMVLAVAMGIGASMTTLTVYHVLSGNPIPHKSERLFDVQIDAGSLGGDWTPGLEPQFQLTRYDAEALLREAKAERQVMMSGSQVPVTPANAQVKPFYATARMTSSDFFAMFEAPLHQGSAWDAAADAAKARVVVISRSLNDKVFGGENSVGRELQVRGQSMRVVGVLGDWRPVPHYFDLSMGGSYDAPAELYLPFSTAMDLGIGSSGNMDCWKSPGPLGPRDLNAPCSWVQYWVQLASPGEAPAFRRYLEGYSEEQRRSGRFERPVNVRLRNVMEHLVHREVLPRDVTLQTWLAGGFLAVCLVNTVGLLLAKWLRRSPEIGVRRALGATRGAIFAQVLVEAGLIGVLGGLVGLGLSALGLWLVRLSPAEYAPLASMDWAMFGLTLALSLAASLAAGLLPAWQATRVMPAQHLKAL